MMMRHRMRRRIVPLPLVTSRLMRHTKSSIECASVNQALSVSWRIVGLDLLDVRRIIWGTHAS